MMAIQSPGSTVIDTPRSTVCSAPSAPVGLHQTVTVNEAGLTTRSSAPLRGAVHSAERPLRTAVMNPG